MITLNGTSSRSPTTASGSSNQSNHTADIKSLHERLAKAEAEVARLKGQNDKKVIKFGDTNIDDVTSALAFTSQHFTNNSYGLLFDVSVLCEWLVEDSFKDQDTMLNSMKKRHDLKIHTQADAKCLYAFEVGMPRLFFNGAVAPDRKNPCYFTSMKSYNEWCAPGTGIKARIMSNLAYVDHMMSETINKQLRGNETARALAITMLATSLSWMNNFLRFIDEKMNELTVDAKFPVPAAFSLTTMCGRRILKDCIDAHEGVHNSMVIGNGNATCAAILYGALRCHDVMKEFNDVNFKNHAAVTSEHVKFLATHSGSDSMKGLEDKMKTMEESVKTLGKTVRDQGSKADTASNNVDLLKPRVTSLEKRVKNVEDKKMDK